MTLVVDSYNFNVNKEVWTVRDVTLRPGVAAPPWTEEGPYWLISV